VKKVVVLASALFLFASVCAASPLTDYSQGKAAIDITFDANQDVSTSSNGPEVKSDGKNSNIDGTITIGVGNKFAVQYRQMDSEGDAWLYTGIPRVNHQEFNLLYQVNKNVSAFTGFTKTSFGAKQAGMELKGPNNNGWHIGLVGSVPIAKKTTAYGIVSAGSDIRSWEAGVSYALAKNTELNILYRDFKADDLTWGGGSVDTRVKGFGYGLTFKF
jgi:hypothetical protein